MKPEGAAMKAWPSQENENPMKRMRDKIVIVSGGAGGIGREIAARMALEGAAVLVSDINLEGAEAVASQLGNGSSAVYVDAYDAGSPEAMVQTAIDRYGRLDVLVNNAADTSLLRRDRTILETEIETFDRSIAANLRAVFVATKAALPHLLQRGGAIINIASATALFGDSWLVAYSSAKAAVIELTRSTAVQYGKQGVRCNSICPGVIAHETARKLMSDAIQVAFDSAFTSRLGAATDVAALTAFLA